MIEQLNCCISILEMQSDFYDLTGKEKKLTLMCLHYLKKLKKEVEKNVWSNGKSIDWIYTIYSLSFRNLGDFWFNRKFVV